LGPRDKMKKVSPILIIILGLLLLTQYAQAQTTVVTKPLQIVNVDNQSSTVAVTNTFQQVFPASTSVSGRTACTIQNTGTNPMYVFFGATADATIAKSVKIIAGQPVTCDSNNTVLKTAVQITGTATETYYASQQ